VSGMDRDELEAEERLGRLRDETRGEDPFALIIGLVDDPDGPDDVAVNHDHYLYGAPKVEP
jgi:hypothetical protein